MLDADLGLPGCAQHGHLEGASAPDQRSEEETLDRRRALERLHDLIRQLRPLDRHVMLLYLEQLDAASIAEITGLSAANVATKVSRIKQLLVQRFHEGKKP